MSGRPLFGLVAALLVEGRHWIRLRWDFEDAAYESAWQLTFVLIVLVGVLIWLDEIRATAVLVLLSWLPLLLLPVQFVQTYGMREWVQLGAFSVIAKRSRIRNQRLGLIEDTVRFNFGNVLFVVSLLASAVGSEKLNYAFLPGLVILSSWALLATKRCRLWSLIPAMTIAGLMSLLGQLGIEYLENWVQQQSGARNEDFNPNFNRTLIGTSGSVMQSSEIVWRMKNPARKKVPLFLRTATFSSFYRNHWQNKPTPFMELDSRSMGDEFYHFIRETSDLKSLTDLPNYTLRGGVSQKVPLPLPGDVAGLSGLEGDRLEMNELGVVQLQPSEPVIETKVYWGSQLNPEEPVAMGAPVKMSTNEEEAIRRVVDEMGLRNLPDLKSKLSFLNGWFQTNFEYTRDLTIGKPIAGDAAKNQQSTSALEQFLTKVKAGHCEYFATAATLMLREAGIHSQYAIGYVVTEKDSKRNEYVIRGTHAHAWCRVWDQNAQRWMDFDPTPSIWIDELVQNADYMQDVRDFIRRVREDFYLWRTDPKHKLIVVSVVTGIGLFLGVFVVLRLWRSRRKVKETALSSAYEGLTVQTPLHELENIARKVVGPRPVGLPYALWLSGLHHSIQNTELLDDAIALHQRIRFGPMPSHLELQNQLAELVMRLKQDLQQLG